MFSAQLYELETQWWEKIDMGPALCVSIVIKSFQTYLQ